MFLWSQFITFFGGLRAQNTFSLNCTDFLDSIDSTESTDIIDSIDSILVPQRVRQHSHQTQRENKSTAGRTQRRRPIGTFVTLCVWCECWRSLCVAQV